MANEWDRDTNILTEEERLAERERLWQEQVAERARIVQENYIRPPGMSREEIEESFPRHTNRYRNANDMYDNGASHLFNNDIYLPYGPNKLWYVCHNCGNMGWKDGNSHQLFKCYECSSRNVALIRAAHISKILREHSEYSTNMQEVYNERRERLRRQRAERST